MDRILKVKGTGRMKITPDTVSMAIDMREILPGYAAAVEASAKNTNALADALAGEGFDRGLLKTVSFDVAAKFDYVRDERGNSERRFLGYEYAHELTYDMPRDNARLSAFLNVLTRFNFGFSFRFTVKDAERVKNDLLAAAVKDATEKAAVLAAAAGVKLLAPAEIDYSSADTQVRSRAFMAAEFSDNALARSSAPVSVDLNPDDIGVSDTVTVVWTIA